MVLKEIVISEYTFLSIAFITSKTGLGFNFMPDSPQSPQSQS